MLSTFKELFEKITKPDAPPLGVIFVLLITDFSISNERIEYFKNELFSSDTITQINHSIDIITDISYWAFIVSFGILLTLGSIEYIADIIHMRSLNIFIYNLKLEISHILPNSASAFSILFIVQHILNNSINSKIKLYCALFSLFIIGTSWLNGIKEKSNI